MPMNDDPSDLADWGEEEEAPQDTAESTGGIEADAVSLGGDDDDDFEALNKYHQKTWDDTNQMQESQSSNVAPLAKEVEPENMLRPPESVRASSEAKSSSPGKDSSLNAHGLPPKPQSPLGLRTVSAGAASVAAVAMAPRTNGNQKNTESEKDSGQPSLPPGWEERISRKGERYYYDTVADFTTWDHPLSSKSAGRPRTESDQHLSKSDKGNPSTYESSQRNRRSRSPRGRKKRSPSPQPIPQRRRSRSLDRGSSYRPGRDSPPRKEPARLPRDVPTTRPRGRQSSLERPRSPRYYRGVDHYSPPRPSKDERDGHHRERRPEISQSSSTRHRSPPRTRSQERNSYRPMEIDHYEPHSHGSVRRRRSSDSPDATDNKRRRVQEPIGRGIDRYVPDHGKNDRMDLDPPSHSVHDTKRFSGPESSTTHPRDLSSPPYRRANDPPAIAAPEKALPAPHKERTQPHASSQTKQNHPDTMVTIQRSRGPLPSQAVAMRFGNRKRPEDSVQSINQKHQNFEQAPRGPRADRERASGRVTPPPVDRAPQPQRRDRSPEQRSHAERTRPKETSPPTERGNNPRVERGRQGDITKPDVTERHTGTTFRGTQQLGQGNSRQPPPNSSKDSNDTGRGKGRGPKPPATSGSNKIPIENSRYRYGQGGGQLEQPAGNADQSGSTSKLISQNSKLADELELAVPNADAPKARTSRFGPKQSAIPQAQIEGVPIQPQNSVSWNGDDDPPSGKASSPAARPTGSLREEYARESGYDLQDQGERAPEAGDILPSPTAQGEDRREDEPRIDGNRNDLAHHTSANDPMVSEESRDALMRQDSTHLDPSSPVEGNSQGEQQIARADQERSDTMQRKGSLLERLAPGPAAGQSGGRDDGAGQEATPGGEVPEKTRPRRARRSGRANRR